MKILSIVVLNFNTKNLLRNCLSSLRKVEDEADFEVIVIDNASNDGSVQMVEEEFNQAKLVKNFQNLGFAKGNNRARKFSQGEYVLFLNSDSEVKKGVLKETLEYMNLHPEVGALSCKTILPDGSLDPDARRSFPTPWVSLTHFSGLDRFFPKSELFSKYWYGYKPTNEIQEVDVIQGAFFLTKKKVLDEVGWFDEDYFLDGEDIDLCWKIKKAGYKIIYYPKVSILHIKGASKDKKRSFGRVTKEEWIEFINAGVNSMEIFYRKRLFVKYPLIFNFLVILGIRTLRLARYIKALLS